MESLNREARDNFRIVNSLTEETMNQHFRAFMIKLSSMEAQLEEFVSNGIATV